jgi:ADP-ribose pyrophosphatase YjhB (NUDIX family)
MSFVISQAETVASSNMAHNPTSTTGFANPGHQNTGQPELPSGFLQPQQAAGYNPYAQVSPVGFPSGFSQQMQPSYAPPGFGSVFARPEPAPFSPNPQQGFVNNRHALANDLGDGFSYENVAFIAKTHYSPQEGILADRLDAGWKPAGAGYKFPQRCPAIWTDNISIVYTRGMPEPMIALALWSKDVVCFGTSTKLSGLVSIGGGHYEAKGDKSCGSYSSIKFEPGHISSRVAADTELNEEVGVRPENVRHTRLIAVEDNVLGDQRKHGVRIIFARWVEQNELKPSKELTKIVLIPLSQMHRLIAGEQYRIEGTSYGMILGHDKMIERVFKLPQWKLFLQEVAQFSQMPVQMGNAGPIVI